jgi:hypothetical protein
MGLHDANRCVAAELTSRMRRERILGRDAIVHSLKKHFV